MDIAYCQTIRVENRVMEAAKAITYGQANLFCNYDKKKISL